MVAGLHTQDCAAASIQRRALSAMLPRPITFAGAVLLLSASNVHAQEVSRESSRGSAAVQSTPPQDPTWSSAELALSADEDVQARLSRAPGFSPRAGSADLHYFGAGLADQQLTLNGLRIASSEFFDLSMVPTAVVGTPVHFASRLTLHRAYRPQLAASWGTASVDLQTLPTGRDLSIQATGAVGYRVGASMQRGWDSPGGDLDWLSVDDGTRSLGDTLPPEPVRDFNPRNGTPTGPSPDEVAQQVSNFWDPRRVRTGPDTGLALSVQDASDGPVPYRFGVALVHGQRRLRDRTTTPMSASDVDVWRQHARLGAIADLQIPYAPDHSATATFFMLREARDSTTFVPAQAQVPGSTTLSFSTRQVLGAQLRSEHRVADRVDVTLRYGFARGAAETPDERQVAYGTEQVVGLNPQPTSIFQSSSENTHDAGLLLELPLYERAQLAVSAKAGVTLLWRNYDFERRTLPWLVPTDGVEAGGQRLEPVFVEAGYRPRETTSDWGRRSSDQREVAGYGSLHGQMGAFQAHAGLRVEKAVLDYRPAVEGAMIGGEGRWDDLSIVPSLGGRWSHDRGQVSLDVSRTALRPGPTRLSGSFDQIGLTYPSPALETSRIWSVVAAGDVAMWPGARGLMTAHLRRLQDPQIRTVEEPENGSGFWVNLDEPWSWWGASFAMEQRLQDLVAWLVADLHVSVTYNADPKRGDIPLSDSTSPVGPSWVVQAIAGRAPERGFGAWLAYRYASDVELRSSLVAVDLVLTDTRAPTHELDVMVGYAFPHGLALRASVQNLLNTADEGRINGQWYYRTTRGQRAQLALSWQPL